MPCSPAPIYTRLRLPGKGSPKRDKGKVCPFGRKVIESKLKYGFGCPKSASRKECEDILCNTRLKPLIIQRFLSFPPTCRVFMVIRNGDEIFPTGETVLKKGDILLLAGIKTDEEEVLRLFTQDEDLGAG